MENKIYYGVWIPKQGWLQVNGEAMAWEDKGVALSVARRVGNNARVEFVDDALRDLAPYLLSVEQQKEKNKWTKKIMAMFRRRK